MFFVHSVGRVSRQKSARTLEELGPIVTKDMVNKTFDAIVVSIGKTDEAVMPYVWIRRNFDNEDVWEGELGDCIRLGIKDGSLVEHDPIQMLSLNEAIKQGLAEESVSGNLRTVRIKSENELPPKNKKLSNEEILLESKRMVDSLFDSIYDED